MAVKKARDSSDWWLCCSSGGRVVEKRVVDIRRQSAGSTVGKEGGYRMPDHTVL